MPGSRNILFLVFDTMRLDAISVYNEKRITPNFSKLASESIVFKNNISSAPWTVPSHASMFTGKYPMEHKVQFSTGNRDFLATSKLMNEYKGSTIAEFLQKQGYSTYGVSANTGIIPGSGFDRGFDIFTFFDPMGNFTLNNEWSSMKEDIVKRFGDTKKEIFKNMLFKDNPVSTFGVLNKYFKVRKRVNNSYKRYDFPMNKSGQQIIDAMQRTSLSQPFFFFINFMEFHEPYVRDFSPQQEQAYPLGLTNPSRKIIEGVRSAYYREAEQADWELGQVIKFLKENNIYDNTALVVTSDHGQSLFEHDFYGHGIFLHDELIRVPLMIKLPMSQPRQRIINELFSNTGLYDIVKSLIYDADPIIQSFPFVLSEADGSLKVPDSLISENEDANNRLKIMDSRRVAIFKGGFKLVVNGTGKNVEYFGKDGRTVDREQYRDVYSDLFETVSIVGWS